MRSFATSPGQPYAVPPDPSTVEVVWDPGNESQQGLWADLSPLHEDSFQDWTLESVVSGSAYAGSVTSLSRSNYSNASHDDEDSGELSTPEEPRLWLSDLDHLNPMAVRVALDTSEALAFTFYTERISRILPAHDAPDNPYRRLTAIAIHAPVLLHTVISIATAFMHNHGGLATYELTATRQARALSSLRQTLSKALNGKGESRLIVTEAIVFAILLQIFYLALTGGMEIEPHFASATYFLRVLGYLPKPPTGFLGRALVQRYAMIDVARAIYRRTRPLSEADFWFYHTGHDLDQTQSSFKIMTGCPHAVLVFLVQVTNLAASTLEQPETPENTAKAIELEADMHIYRRSQPSALNDPLSEAFYWTAHLLLQRRVYLEHPRSRRVQFTRNKIFELVQSMALGYGPDSSVFLPLNISGREAMTLSDREWIRTRARDLTHIYGIRTNEHCMKLMEQIWACVDAGWSDDSTLERELLEIEAQSQCFVF
ncbi:hypothetical protein LTR84_003437 [Exophiala bonariae]|uniref:Transcription factor domain-containing protein n=1 Tax=Exophiala bonariae TaxID=1690606 RepID=A0AAV9N843_9EURO|nr:hypothetical protein LTR84_003437 [Exophiala bonariae]